MYKKLLALIIIFFTLISSTSCKENYNKKEYNKINLDDKTTWVNTQKKYLPSITDIEQIYNGMPFKDLILLMGRPERVFTSFYNDLMTNCFCYKLNIDSYCFVFINNKSNYEVKTKIIANNENSKEKEKYFSSELAAVTEEYNSMFNNSKEILPNLYDLTKITEGMYIIDAIRILGRPQALLGAAMPRFYFELENNITCSLIFDTKEDIDIKQPLYIRAYIHEISIFVSEKDNIDN